jgi:hypothetical protein
MDHFGKPLYFQHQDEIRIPIPNRSLSAEYKNKCIRCGDNLEKEDEKSRYCIKCKKKIKELDFDNPFNPFQSSKVKNDFISDHYG